MASRGDIKIPVGVDAGGVAKAINNGVIEPLLDAHEAAEKLGNGDFGRDFDREMDRAQDATEDLSRELDDTRADLKKLGYAAKDAGDDGATGMHRIKEGAGEVQREIGQNLGETVSSFRGDLSDLGQVGQDTLGGLAASMASLGPAGLIGSAVLAGGALIWGAVSNGIQDAKDKQDALNEAAAKFADAYTQGIDGAISSASIFAEIQSITTDPDRYDEAKTNAKNWGVDVSTAMRAMAGDATALQIAQDSLDGKSDDLNNTLNDQGQVVSDLGGAFAATNSEITDGQTALDVLNGALSEGKTRADNAAQALYDYATNAGTATGKTDDLGNAIVTMPDGKEVVVNVLTGQAYQDIETLQNTRIADLQAIVRLIPDGSAVDAWRSPVKVGYVNYKAAQTAWD